MAGAAVVRLLILHQVDMAIDQGLAARSPY